MTRIIPTITFWLALVTVTSAQEASCEPRIGLNHFFVIVDQATYQDILENEYLKNTFAITQSRTTKRNDVSYSGFYVYGENTYFEFLTHSLSPWKSAVILSGDYEGDLKRVKREQLPRLEISDIPITREYENTQVPWFFTASNFGYPNYSELGLGLMEYHPQYLSKYYPDIGKQASSMSRQSVLKKYSSILGISQSDRLLKDVVGITTTATSSERSAILQLFESLDFMLTAQGSYDLLTGKEFELRVGAQLGSGSKILEVQMQLHDAPDEEVVLQFGADSVLRIFKDGQAVWSF